MKARPSLAVPLSLMLVLQPGLAGTAHGQVHHRDSGTPSCGLWVEARQTDSPMISVSGLQQMEHWIFGYLSGVAISAGKDILKDANRASILRWIDEYCKANLLNQALRRVVEVRVPRAGKEVPSPVMRTGLGARCTSANGSLMCYTGFR